MTSRTDVIIDLEIPAMHILGKKIKNNSRINGFNHDVMKDSTLKSGARILLGSALVFAGISHLTFARKAFRAQVPEFIPLKKDDTVVYSGFAEIALGSALLFTPEKHRPKAGKVAATFFTAIFPGNIAQFINHKNAFGLDTDGKRLTRLLFQPVLVLWALKSTN